MQPESIEVLTGNISKVVILHPCLESQAKIVKERFSTILQLFSKCHNGYTSSNSMDNTKINELVSDSCNSVYKYTINNSQERDIDNFMTFYRSMFPDATVLPKMQILDTTLLLGFNGSILELA